MEEIKAEAATQKKLATHLKWLVENSISKDGFYESYGVTRYGPAMTLIFCQIKSKHPGLKILTDKLGNRVFIYNERGLERVNEFLKAKRQLSIDSLSHYSKLLLTT
jgi:hypothetical protein